MREAACERSAVGGRAQDVLTRPGSAPNSEAGTPNVLRTAPPSSAWRANERAKHVARVRASGRARDGRGQVTYQKLVVQAEVGAEGLVRCNIVGRDSVDVGDLLQLGQRVVEGLGLQRAAGRGVLRVEEDHLRLAAGLDVHLPAVLIRQGEGRQLVAFLHGSANDLTNERSASERVHRAVARLDCQPIPTRRLARDGREMEVRTDCIVSLMMNSEVLSGRRCTGAPRWGRRDVWWCMGVNEDSESQRVPYTSSWFFFLFSPHAHSTRTSSSSSRVSVAVHAAPSVRGDASGLLAAENVSFALALSSDAGLARRRLGRCAFRHRDSGRADAGPEYLLVCCCRLAAGKGRAGRPVGGPRRGRGGSGADVCQHARERGGGALVGR